MSSDMGSSTIAKDNYDIVKVDLDDGRDYPIYIGTGYSDKEGRYLVTRTPPQNLCRLIVSSLTQTLVSMIPS